MPRQALPGGLPVDGNFFPEGTEMGTPVYALHHQEHYYPDAFTFKPARWLVGPSGATPAESISSSQSTFCPFSTGPWSCAQSTGVYRDVNSSCKNDLFV